MKNFPVFALLILCHVFFTACSGQELPNKDQLMKDVNYLASDQLKGRETGTAGNKMARDYVIARFEDLGIKKIGDAFTSDFNFKRNGIKNKGVNVIGKIDGKVDSSIIITAHYDHEGVKNGQIYNGADDNASGVAGLLAIAKYFIQNKPNHNLIFVAFDAEEKGLQGARHFVKNMPLDIKKILLNVNMDMISRSDKNEIYVAGTYHYPQYKEILISANSTSNIKLFMGHDSPELGHNDWTTSSDHGPFHKVGIPFLYFGVEDHADYHQPTDDASKINPEFLEGTTNLILDVILKIDQGQK